MATFTFKWPHAAEEVYVTGTFDEWSKSVQLDKVGDVFQKTVTIPDASAKIYYKFVVDGNWVTDHAAPIEKDPEGNDNNVLLPKDMEKLEETGPAAAILSNFTPESTTAQLAGEVPLEKKEAEPAAAILNTVTPESTTAQLAGQVPLEEKTEEKKEAELAAAILNTVTPESTTAQLAGEVPLEKKEEPAAAVIDTVTPESTTAQLAGQVPVEPKADTLPGGYPETPATELGKEFKVSPLPAANGAVNPIDLAPGAKIPDEVTAGSVTDNVTLDKESYEKSDRLPGLENIPAPVVDVGKIIPESSLPIVGADDNKEFGVKPLPATEGALNPIELAPGAKIPDEVTAGSTTDHVTLDKESYEQSDRLPGLDTTPAPISEGKIIPEAGAEDEDKEFSVKPLPAFEGALNPIHLEPGAKIPEGVTTGSITDNVTLDKESYEKSDRIPGIETELPPISGGNIIPESSLPIAGPGDFTINTVTPEATTAALASQVPLEPKVPEIVKKSQEEAHVDPEASGIAEEVREKAAVEEELLEVILEAPSTSEGTAGKGTEKSETDKTLTETVPAAAATAGAAVIGAAFAAKESATHAATDAIAQLPDSVKEVLPATLQETPAAPAVEEAKPTEVAAEVPVEVKESIEQAGESAEAAANPVAVEEKKEVEAELLKEVKPVEAEPALKAEEPKAAPVKEAKTEEVKPAPAVPETNGTTSTAPETNGTTTAAPEVAAAPAAVATTTTEAPATKAAEEPTAEKKKKNRLSSVFKKIKQKLTDRKHE